MSHLHTRQLPMAVALLASALAACASGVFSAGGTTRAAAASERQASKRAEVIIEPTTGDLSTSMTLTLEGVDPTERFDRDAIVQWTGRYVPFIGRPTEPFTISIRSAAATELTGTRMTVPVIAAAPNRVPALAKLLIPGTMEGTATVPLSSGARIETAFDFAPFINAQWKDIRYADGPGGLDPPTVSESEAELHLWRISDLRDLESLKQDVLWGGTSLHLAIQTRFAIEVDPTKPFWPPTIHTDVVTTDRTHAITDRVMVPLFPQPVAPGATSAIYQSDLARPIILVDTRVDASRFPDFSLVYCPQDGHIAVAGTLPQAQAELVALPRKAEPLPVRTPAEALTALRTRAGMTTARCLECLEIFRTASARGESPPWGDLTALVNDAELHDGLRRRLMEFFLEDGDAAAIRKLVRALMDDSRSEPPADLGDLKRWSQTSYHCSMMLQSLSTRSTADLSSLQPEAGELLEMFLERPLVHPGPLVDLLIALPADAEWKARIAGRIIEVTGGRSGSAGSPIVDMLGEPEIAAFRARIAEATLGPEGLPPRGFSIGIIDALADLGDREILPDLRRLAEGAHPNWRTRVEWWIRMIEMQAEPRDLVAFSTSTSEGTQTYRRLWALGRALELGVSKDDVRAAILAYAEAIRPQTEAARAGSLQREPLAAAKMAAYLLVEFKQFGLDRGVLREDDLPGVPPPVRIIGCG